MPVPLHRAPYRIRTGDRRRDKAVPSPTWPTGRVLRTQGGIRTPNLRGLSALPLPVELPGHRGQSGSRTLDARFAGPRCAPAPRPWLCIAGSEGFEPPSTGSEPAMLPGYTSSHWPCGRLSATARPTPSPGSGRLRREDRCVGLWLGGRSSVFRAATGSRTRTVAVAGRHTAVVLQPRFGWLGGGGGPVRQLVRRPCGTRTRDLQGENLVSFRYSNGPRANARTGLAVA